MSSRAGFPIHFPLQTYFHSIAECDALVVGIIVPRCAFPRTIGYFMIGRKCHCIGCFLLSVRVGEVYMFPTPCQFIFCYRQLGHGAITFRHYYRPSRTGPFDGTYMPHHHGIARIDTRYIFVQTSLRGIIPILISVKL